MQRPHLRLPLLCLLAVTTFSLSGCLFRTRTLDRQLSNNPLKTATQQDLIAYLNDQDSKIQSMQATVDIDASAGDSKNGKITDYKEIRGYVLARKPAMLRMKGLLPVVRNTAFDMVSDGKEFKLSIPPKNKFVIGSSNAETRDSVSPSSANEQSDKRLENMRPQYIYDALLLPSVGTDEIPFLENGYETVLDARKHRVDQPDYELAVLRKGPQGWYQSRRIEFSRTDLLPYRQRIYDQQGNVATDVHYENYKDFGGMTFPNTIQIERPQENYDIILTMVKLEINKSLTDDQFALDQPPGAEVIRLDQPKSSVAKTSNNQTSNLK
jgi:outer membrane lipoprotein-sorting protein